MKDSTPQELAAGADHIDPPEIVHEPFSENKKQAPPYAVGYKRPPLHSRFKPGVSGNPRGRSRQSRTLAAAFERFLAKPMQVTGRNGKVESRNYFDVLVQALGFGAIRNAKAAREFIELMNKCLGAEAAGKLQEQPLPTYDEVRDKFIRGIERAVREAAESGDPAKDHQDSPA